MYSSQPEKNFVCEILILCCQRCSFCQHSSNHSLFKQNSLSFNITSLQVTYFVLLLVLLWSLLWLLLLLMLLPPATSGLLSSFLLCSLLVPTLESSSRRFVCHPRLLYLSWCGSQLNGQQRIGCTTNLQCTVC